MWRKQKSHINSEGQLSDDVKKRILELTTNNDFKRTVQRILDTKVSINTTHENGETLLYLSCRNREYELTDYLLDIGADPNKIPPNGMTAWYFMLFFDNGGKSDYTESLFIETRIQIIRKLCKLCVLPFGDMVRLRHLFIFACNADMKDLLNRILEKGYTVNKENIRYVLEKGSTDIVLFLCKEGRKLLKKLDEGELEALVIRNNRELDKFLLDFVAKRNQRRTVLTLFQVSARNGCSELTSTIIEQYFNWVQGGINDELISTILRFYCKHRSARKAFFRNWRAVAEKRQDNLTSRYAETLLIVIMSKIANRHCDLNPADHTFKQNGISLLAKTIRLNRIEMVRNLLEYHFLTSDSSTNFSIQHSAINESRSVDNYFNPMCCAVSCCDYEMVHFFVEQGENGNVVDSGGCYKSFPPLFCGIRVLMNMRTEVFVNSFEPESALENIKQIVRVYYDISQLSQFHKPDDSLLNIVMCGLTKSNVENVNSFRFKFGLLKFLIDPELNLDLHVFQRGSLLERTTAFNFLVTTRMNRAGVCHLLQAGADWESVRFWCQELQVGNLYDVDTHVSNTDICKVFVLERNSKSWHGLFDNTHDFSVKTLPTTLRKSVETFQEWCDHVMSSPSSLQCHCRTSIRKLLINVSNHRSILTRIESLHMPESLKQYLRYEGNLTEVDLSASIAEPREELHSIYDSRSGEPSFGITGAAVEEWRMCLNLFRQIVLFLLLNIEHVYIYRCIEWIRWTNTEAFYSHQIPRWLPFFNIKQNNQIAPSCECSAWFCHWLCLKE